MTDNLDRYKDDLRKLSALGDSMLLDLAKRSREQKGKVNKNTWEQKKNAPGELEQKYQEWYTESCSLIRQIVPGRLSEFEALYTGDARRKGVNLTTYTIQDWLMGVRFNVNAATADKLFEDFRAMFMRFQTQLQILKSAEARFRSSLFDIRQLVQADLFDSEVESARELHRNGFFRPAGVVAGVILESHLCQVCTNHSVTTRKKNPTISDYNDLLKNNNVIDVPLWRFIQRLGDLRNLSVHKKDREPTKDDVSELIDGVEKTTKTLY